LLAFPSSEEGFGLPVVEAMACGTPVVAGASAAVAEVAGGAAHLVANSDPMALARAVAALLAQARLHTDLRERGLKRSAAFDWRLTATQTSEIYRSVVNRGARSLAG
jgi:alpha-1,3-rhamnosyl/mannosyltransferase